MPVQKFSLEVLKFVIKLLSRKDEPHQIRASLIYSWLPNKYPALLYQVYISFWTDCFLHRGQNQMSYIMNYGCENLHSISCFFVYPFLGCCFLKGWPWLWVTMGSFPSPFTVERTLFVSCILIKDWAETARTWDTQLLSHEPFGWANQNLVINTVSWQHAN